MAHFLKVLVSVLLIVASPLLMAASGGCRSCTDSHGCERQNKECRGLCRSSLISNSDKLAACGLSCTTKWKACDNAAKAACSYYCKEDE